MVEGCVFKYRVPYSVPYRVPYAESAIHYRECHTSAIQPEEECHTYGTLSVWHSQRMALCMALCIMVIFDFSCLF